MRFSVPHAFRHAALFRALIFLRMNSLKWPRVRPTCANPRSRRARCCAPTSRLTRTTTNTLPNSTATTTTRPRIRARRKCVTLWTTTATDSRTNRGACCRRNRIFTASRALHTPLPLPAHTVRAAVFGCATLPDSGSCALRPRGFRISRSAMTKMTTAMAWLTMARTGPKSIHRAKSGPAAVPIQARGRVTHTPANRTAPPKTTRHHPNVPSNLFHIRMQNIACVCGQLIDANYSSAILT